MATATKEDLIKLFEDDKTDSEISAPILSAVDAGTDPDRVVVWIASFDDHGRGFSKFPRALVTAAKALVDKAEPVIG